MKLSIKSTLLDTCDALSKGKQLAVLRRNCIFALMCAAMLCHAVVSHTAPLLTDDFEDGNSTGWTTAGTWSVVTDGSKVFKNTNDSGLGIASSGSTAWNDYSVEARVKPLSFNGASRFMAIYGRFTDTNNSYYITLRNGNILEIKKLVAGTAILITAKTYPVSVGTWYKLKLEMTGSTLKAYVNDALELAATDTALSSGKAAIGMSYSTGQFDDVNVSGGPIGFGAAATGGAGGTVVTVTTATDLKTYAQASAAYIIQVSGSINLATLSPTTLYVASNKTIRGTGTSPSVYGGTFSVSGQSNVIFQDLHISSSYDGIQLVNNANHIWIDHCTFTDCGDGSVDIGLGSDNVTVSWCKFQYPSHLGHEAANLIGSSDTAYSDRGKLHVTMHHNWYATGVQDRMPSVRFGRVHVFNNYYSASGNNGTCVNFRIESEVLLQNSYFEGVKGPWASTQLPGTIFGKLNQSGNTLVNSTSVNYSMGGDTVFTPSYPYSLESAATAKASVIANAGCKL
jgi:pectate lyase